MPTIRIGADTHSSLVELKRGNDSLDRVIKRLLMVWTAHMGSPAAAGQGKIKKGGEIANGTNNIQVDCRA